MRTPMRRFGDAKELAGAAVFLASEAASFVTGEIVAVDGGFCERRKPVISRQWSVGGYRDAGYGSGTGMKITNAYVNVTSPGRNFVTLKIETDEGIYGLGDATLNGRDWP